MNQKRAASSFYARIFSRMYDPVMRSFEEKILLQRRQSLLENLRGDILHLGLETGQSVGQRPPPGIETGQ